MTTDSDAAATTRTTRDDDMTSEEFLTALSGLENRIGDRIQTLYTSLNSQHNALKDSIGEKINSQSVELATLRLEVKMRSCPRPGLCEPLEAKHIELEKEMDRRFTPLEQAIQQAIGARKTLILIASLSSVVSGIAGLGVGAKFFGGEKEVPASLSTK